MAQTSIIETVYDEFNSDTGEIITSTKQTVKKGTKLEPTDEFIKVSKYLSLIFTYNNIPLKLVPISIMIAEQMQFKTNIVYLLKPQKVMFAEMLDISLDRVNKLIQETEKYNIIRRKERGIYEVNSFLFSTGSTIETRELQAHFDIDRNLFIAHGVQTNKLTGQTIRKAIANKKDKQIEGQESLFDNPLFNRPMLEKRVTSNKFNNFEQAKYTSEEMKALEEKLLDN